MRLFSILLTAAGLAPAQPYIAKSLTPTGSQYHFVNLMGLNNKGQVLGDACVNGAGCAGVDRFTAVWRNGVISPLTIPSGYVYLAVLNTYYINNSGTVVGTLQEASSTRTHVVVWTNGIPAVQPDAPPLSGCSGSPSSSSYGLNTAGHILGSTGYPVGPSNGCSTFWV